MRVYMGLARQLDAPPHQLHALCVISDSDIFEQSNKSADRTSKHELFFEHSGSS